jgi:3-oxoacyl-[acyl-carrier protein] reductase
MISFDGKVVAVTGAAGDIGAATARRFLAAGARLVLADLRGDAVDAFALSLDPSGERVAAIAHDACSSSDADAMAMLAVERFGGVDILVTAAGLFPEDGVTETSDEQWHRVLGINLDGVLYASRAMIPVMRDGGSMVHIASIAGHRGSSRHAHYATAKAGVLGLTRSLAQELAPRDIRVNAVSPGIIATPMVDDLMRQKGDFILAATPMGRMGTPDEVAGVIAFLASDLASFVTGETVHVNGGYYIAS